jgi:cell shape-determining protein MreC
MLNTERRNRRGNREIRFEVNSNYYEAVSKLLSDYKRVLKENEEKTTILLAGAEKVKQLEKENKKLKEDRNNNNEMVALARNEVLNYMTGYEDGKKHKMTATAQVVENQQYYIIQKQMEKYEEHIKRLKKENEKLKNKLLDTLKGQKVIKEEIPQYIKENYISKEKSKRQDRRI